MNSKAMIAMSGGVDSSVAAKLMCDKGYDCTGFTMLLYDGDIKCSGQDNIKDASAVAKNLGIKNSVLDFRDAFKECVISSFIADYEEGNTPNPCIECNRYIKFGKMYEEMLRQGYDYIVTGHYARINYNNDTGRYELLKAVDKTKDQSYVLYSLSQEQLSHTIFPLGEYSKDEIRKIAEKNGFINANKPDSQDICFVPDGDYAQFIKKYTGKEYPKGNYVDKYGKVLGNHNGIIGYTVGQRKGLGIALGKPAFVTGKNVSDNTVILSTDENDLFCKKVKVNRVNWISANEITEPMELKVKLRYRHIEQPAVVYREKDESVTVEFYEPQRAPSPGQSAVFYSDDTVVGGGIIVKGE